MCGLVGMFGNINDNHKEMFRTMLIADTTRGKDGTGVFAASFDGNYAWEKTVGTPEMFNYGEASNLISENLLVEMDDLCCLMGHNRHQTKGKVNSENAHPFEFESLVGMHNGTLRLLGQLHDGHSFDVDSEALYNSIDLMQRGESDKFKTFEDVYQTVTGAMALTWWDKQTGELNIFRNNERPLCFMVNEKEDLVFWASEEWILEVAAMVHGVELRKIEELPDHTHYRLSVSSSPETKIKIKKTAIKKKQATTTQVYRPTNTTTSNSGTGKGNVVPYKKAKEEDKDLGGSFLVHGTFHTKMSYELTTHHGCSWCSASLPWEDRHQTYFIDSTTPVCQDCYNHPSLLEYMGPITMEKGTDVH